MARSIKESNRALPFHAQAIRFGEVCVLSKPATIFIPNEYGTFDMTQNDVPAGTIVIPIVCFKAGWKNEVVKVLVGGLGPEYISIASVVERLQ